MGIAYFVLGLVIGSFLSALSWRYPKGVSIAKGRSICPNCKKTLHWYDNIPIFSFLMLRGRCRNCKKPISPRYPLIEFFTAAGFWYIGMHFAQNLPLTLLYLFLYSLLVLIFVVDFENQMIPDSFIFFGVAIYFFWNFLSSGGANLFSVIFAGFSAATLLMFINLATFGRGMGLGDVKFAVLGGMIAGLKFMPIWLLTSFLTGGFAGFILILAKRARLKSKIAFGPFLVIGLVLTLLWGNAILHLLWLNY